MIASVNVDYVERSAACNANAEMRHHGNAPLVDLVVDVFVPGSCGSHASGLTSEKKQRHSSREDGDNETRKEKTVPIQWPHCVGVDASTGSTRRHRTPFREGRAPP